MNNMARQGTWADNIIIQAVANSLNTTIDIIESNAISFLRQFLIQSILIDREQIFILAMYTRISLYANNASAKFQHL